MSFNRSLFVYCDTDGCDTHLNLSEVGTDRDRTRLAMIGAGWTIVDIFGGPDSFTPSAGQQHVAHFCPNHPVTFASLTGAKP